MYEERDFKGKDTLHQTQLRQTGEILLSTQTQMTVFTVQLSALASL